jgi:hypothetical protein
VSGAIAHLHTQRLYPVPISIYSPRLSIERDKQRGDSSPHSRPRSNRQKHKAQYASEPHDRLFA